MALSKIKLVRLQKGLRQWDIARQVGVTESFVSKIETGRVRPCNKLLEKIATVLEVSLECILED